MSSTPALAGSATVTFEQARHGVNALPWRPYDALMPEDRLSVDDAAAVMSVGWTFANLPAVALRPPIAWQAIVAGNRTWAFRLHSWDALGPVLSSYEATRDQQYLEFALSVALDWIEQHPSRRIDPESAWYDMAVALRAYRLAYLVDVAARARIATHAQIAALLTSVREHRAELADGAAFVAHNNHGFFQAAGQLALSARLSDLDGIDQDRTQSQSRLALMVANQFTVEGVHREHSPAYHLLVAQTLSRLVELSLLGDPELVALSRRALEALHWFVLPDGTLATLGDTDPIPELDRPAERVLNEHLRFMLTRGASGRPARKQLQAFPASGYVAIRAPVPRGRDGLAGAAYLVQTAAFHSRVHKHADDLSFIWYDRGEQLLVDPGLYGYLGGRTAVASEAFELGFAYADPRRIYVESTRAHNTVEIDGRSDRRKDPDIYGSALRQWGDADGVLWTHARLDRGGVLHDRVLALRPSHWLLVFDALLDPGGGAHELVQRFHFAPGLTGCHELGAGFALTVPGQPQPLYVHPLLPAKRLEAVRGQEEPALLGWISRQHRTLTPVWTAAFALAGLGPHTFATLLAFADAPPLTRQGTAATTEVGRDATLSWDLGEGPESVQLTTEGGELSLRYRG
jgi:hypothetical protein